VLYAIAACTRNRLAATIPSPIKIAITTTCAATNGGSFPFGASVCNTGTFRKRLHHPHEAVEIQRYHTADHIKQPTRPCQMKYVAPQNRQRQRDQRNDLNDM
jgi:hypothetical protein